MSKAMQYPAWAHEVPDVVKHLKTDVKAGLTDAKVEAAREVYGWNELDKEEGKPLWKLVLEQFDDTLVKILLLAACVSFGLAIVGGDAEEEGLRAFVEPLVILLILILNAIVGVWQESNAEKALDALKEMQSETAKCYRNGTLISDLPARELVPGDIIELRAGDRVPADIRVVTLNTATLMTEQASLTGESVAVNKSLEPVGEDVEIQAKECMLFAGTAVANGSAVGVVTDIGMATEIGKIQDAIQEAAQEEDDTPLKKKLDEFGEMLTKVIGVICLVVWVINYKHFLSFDADGKMVFSFAKCTYYFKIAVALAVAAIPEGLPAVITTCLALGTRKMAKKNAIVRKLPSVETLGCTTVICSDKTGTLTTNQMCAKRFFSFGATADKLTSREVGGSSFDPSDGGVSGASMSGDESANMSATICALCNEASVEYKEGKWRCVGAPTEAALAVLVEKILGEKTSTSNAMPGVNRLRSSATKYATLEFDRNRKSMSVLVKGDGRAASNVLYVKGAAECVIDRCTKVLTSSGKEVALTAKAKSEISKAVEDMASNALRTLAFAYKTGSGLGDLEKYDGGDKHKGHKILQNIAGYEAVESDLVLCGLAGLLDPPREEVKGAIAECEKAGIRVIVITGDNKLTAEAIAKQIGVFEEGEKIGPHNSLTGREFVDLSRDKQIAMLMGDNGGRVFSRAEPKHKQDIVKLLKDQGEVAAMTGDGVNDAPALKLADIGVAMGIAGTEVAKEASDMVLADDNFNTIVAAVAEGRSIYNNMKAFIRYMISSNIGEVASIFITAALGFPEGLIPVQLLWVNLVTDGPPATALGFNPPDLDIMRKPPRRSDDSLITPWVFFRYMVVGMYVGFATVGAFAAWYTSTNFMGIDLSGDGHTPISMEQLMTWGECESWKGFSPSLSYSTSGGGRVSFSTPCEYFTVGKAKASTLSLSVLVAIEMFNALNALSEDGSLLQMPPWVNPYLIVAMFVSFGLHFMILYVPFFADVFSITPLSVNEWLLVLLFSTPVLLVDEVLKFVGRNFVYSDMSSWKRKTE